MSTASSSTPNHILIARLVIYHGEVYRVPGGQRALRAVSGQAWITYAGRDIILRGGERAALPNPADFAVISALGKAPLVLEVLAPPSNPPGGLKLALPEQSAL